MGWLDEGPLPFGKIVDCGIMGYREFCCSLATYEWLANRGGMTHIDGEPVRLTVAERTRAGHNVFVKVEPLAGIPQLKGAEYTWMNKAA